ncbi:MAG: hypothetical protein IT579_16470 [Verrucomicrobia subdivision 3 bacterium]|nr:hypothetical protein [Limisphaerales bacterium]
MNPRLKKILLLLLAAVLLFGVSRVQRGLNVDRERLGLTRIDPLENAPPVLAFTTVALGGFRGLIANALWIRANDLQDEDKFFEMAQLADWITKLEPHFVQVWLVQAWNMAYNISVKFKDFDDRWRWVQRGIALLRDDGLRFNPNETLIYRELAWFFQHKMGANLDDANMRYKQEWLKEMSKVFADKTPDLDELINAPTDDARQRFQLLTNKYKMDPKFMKVVDERYGPLEWRLPESHAIYWGALGLEKAREHPTKIKPDDLIQLRRAIYQSMQLSFQRGRLAANPFAKSFEFGPNLDIIPKVSAAYEQAMQEDAPNRDHIEKAHRNFLRDAVYFLYENNRLADSAQWYKYLGEKYPEKFLIDGNTNSFPRNLTLNEYAVARIVEDLGETSRDRVKAAIEGMLIRGFVDLVLGQPERSAGYRLKARMLRDSYMSNIKGNEDRIGLPPVEETEKEVRERLLDPTTASLPFEMRAILRTQLRLPPEIALPAAGTNAPAGGTNAPAVPPGK